METVTEEIVLGGYRIRWLRKPIKRIHLRITPPNGAITLSTPMYTGRGEAEAFVLSHLSWIAEKRPGCIFEQRVPLLKNGDTAPLFGECFQIEVSLRGRRAASLSDGVIRLDVCDDTEEERRLALTILYRKALAERTERRCLFWREKTGLAPHTITFRRMKSRWGSCGTKRGRITLNLCLAFYDPACLDYVILHELVHLRHPNHGAGFYAMLERYMPDWKERKALLAKSSRDLRGMEPI